MPNIPNEAAASFPEQAELHQADLDALRRSNDVSGVLSGCAVTAQGTPNMTVAVAAGVVLVNGKAGVIRAQNATIGTAHATNPRYDLVVALQNGTCAVIAGTAAANPVKPTLPDARVLLAEVWVPANDTAIGATQIIDKRIILRRPDWQMDGSVMENKDYFGITTGSLSDLGTLADIQQDMRDIAEAGATWVRFDAAWTAIAASGSSPAGWTWTNLDDWVQAAADAGLKIYLSCSYSPPWARPATTLTAGYSAGTATMPVADTTGFPSSGTLTVVGITGLVTYTGKTGTSFTGCSGGSGSGISGAVVGFGSETFGPDNQTRWDSFAEFCSEVVKRYGPTNNTTNLENVSVTVFGIWNEPNLGVFWKPSAGPLPDTNHDYLTMTNIGNYVNMLKTAYTAIKAVSQDALVAAGDIAQYGYYDFVGTAGQDMHEINYLEAMYAWGAGGYFDILAVHPYMGNEEPPHRSGGDQWSGWLAMYALPLNNSMRHIMVKNGDGHKKIWATEFGYNLGGGSPVTEVQQASFLTTAYDLWRKHPWAGPMFWYNHRDAGGITFGLMELTTRRKRAAFYTYQDSVVGKYGPRYRDKSTADQATTSTSLVDITGLSLPMAANADYYFEFFIPYTSGATTNGLGLSVNGPTGLVWIAGEAHIPFGADGGSSTWHGNITAYEDQVLATGTPAVSPAVHFARISGIIRNGTTPGDLKARFRAEVGSSSLTIKQGAWGRLTRI